MLHLSRLHARRFLVARHFLAPPRTLAPTAASVMTIVSRLGSLQFDPLEVPGARNHELVLHARMRGPLDVTRALCDRLAYPTQLAKKREEPKLFEAYNKSLNLLPVDELPWHRLSWERAAGQHTRKILADHATLAASILERIRRDGVLAPSAFDRSETVDGYWGTRTPLSRHVLEALFVTGRVGIARREGNKRLYDVVERLFPASLLERRVSEEEAMRHRLLSRHRAVGLMGEGGAGELIIGTGKAGDRKRHVAALVDDGTLAPVEIEGVRGVRYMLTGERALLDRAATITRKSPAVSFIAPLDPLLWDRRLMTSLFDYDYTWEVYTPPAKRKHGYYVLPILFGDRLVGRIEPRFDRVARTLHIEGAWLEPTCSLDEDGFAPALASALTDYAAFVGATKTTFARTSTCRAIARLFRVR